MQTLTRTVLNTTFTLSILLLPTCYAASYKEIFQQFQAQNEGYAEYKVQTVKHMSNNAIYSSVAASGDVDSDGLKDVIFAIYKTDDKRKSTHRTVVMKGLENDQFQTLLVNKHMVSADFLISLDLRINEGRSFSVSIKSTGFPLQDEAGWTKKVEFGLSGVKLPIKRLFYISPSLSQSASVRHAYTYNFDKSCYVREWNDSGHKTETGKLSLKDTNTFYMNNNTDPFGTNDQEGLVPVAIEGNISTTPDLSTSKLWDC